MATKRFSILGAIICFVATGVAFCDVTKEITVEVKSGILGGWSQCGGSISSYTDWRFYQGFEQITEPAFLRVAGYDQEARIAEEYSRITRITLAGAFVCLGIESIFGAYTLYHLIDSDNYDFRSDEYEESEAKQLTGLIGMAVAAVPGIILGLIAEERGNNLMPLELALKIADEYNSTLK